MIIPIKRTYTSLAGVDFTNDPNKVQLNRSPNSRNMYKDYSSTQGQCVETRPGFYKIAKIGDKNNGIYIFNANSKIEAVVHSKDKLYIWNNYPSQPLENNITIINSNMNDSKTIFFVFDNKLYINDGLNYLVYDGLTLKNVSDIAFVPTTSIGRKPIGGGDIYQPVNLLTGKRKNTFTADGTSKDYYLDTTNIDDNELKITIDGVVVTNYIVNRQLGRITFTTAPIKPTTEGHSNVAVEFSKTINNYVTRISKCKLSIVFDRRVFFSGNSEFPNAVFHSQLEDPTYISDLSYYQDGSDISNIKSLTVGNNLLWVLKESNQQNPTIFYHIPSLDIELGKVYPSKQGNISKGCLSTCCNFNDDIVFMSRYGLEGISGNIDQEQLLSHRSSLIDNKLINENDFEKCEMQEWNGYLLCLINGNIYLADSRQKYQGINGFEYEWYYWSDIKINESKIVVIREYENKLLFGFDDGSIGILGGTNDNGKAIYSCWTMPNDVFSDENHLKTTNKRGGIAKIKTIPNGQVKISVETDKRDEKIVKVHSSAGFDFKNIDFSNFSFTTKNNSHIVFRIKEKKFIDLTLKFYSDEKDRPFGLYDATIEAYIGGYIKR